MKAMSDMNETAFWYQLAGEDHNDAIRDLNLYGNVFAQRDEKGQLRRIPPEEWPEGLPGFRTRWPEVTDRGRTSDGVG